MSLAYHSSGQWLEAALDRENMGVPVFLCCPGPSLKIVDTASLRGQGRFIVALNKAYPFVKPDMWIGFDMPSCFDRSLWWEPFPKICRWDWRNEVSLGRPIKDAPFTYFAVTDDKAHPNEMFRRRGGKIEFVWGGNSFYGALHILLWLGAKSIYLVGCDMGGPADYHDTTVLDYDHRVENRELYAQQARGLFVLAADAGSRGMSIQSCTADSPINKYLPYVPLADALHAAENAVPRDPTAPMLHVREAELCLWSCHPKEERLVVTGCDGNQEWLLPWWWERYSRFNKYPVMFTDLGMSDKARAWCKARGEVVSVVPKERIRPEISGWYRKPFACLKANRRRNLWIDLDCEILGDVAPFFDYAAGGKVGIRLDKKHPASKLVPGTADAQGIVNSGVMAFEHENPAIQEWAERTFENVRHDGNTDQEPLSFALHVLFPERFAPFADGLCVFPVEQDRYNEPTQANTLIRHWTCPEGKRHIREEIAAEKAAQGVSSSDVARRADEATE